MSITIDFPYWGIWTGLAILAPLICTIVTLETHHHATHKFRKDMARREKALKEGTAEVLKARREVSDRDLALNRLANDLERREHDFEERKHELGRAAHDMAIQARIAVTAHDTMPSIPKLED